MVSQTSRISPIVANVEQLKNGAFLDFKISHSLDLYNPTKVLEKLTQNIMV